MQRHINPVIRDPTLRKIIGANALRTVARTDLRFPVSGALVIGALAFGFKQPRPQNRHRLGAVFML